MPKKGEIMVDSLKILIVEDSEDDALLLIRELRKGGYTPFFDRVDSPETLQKALHEEQWDVVITDHNMPRLNSETVLETVNASGIDVPVIIVSGIIPESIAVANMKAGAQDYIMKDNLARLIPAIERELSDARVRSAKRKAENTITHMAYHDTLTGLDNRNELEKRLQLAIEKSRQAQQSHALLYIDLDQFRIVNDTGGYVAGDILLKQLSQLLKDKVRDSDCLARIGGDEFGILLESCPPDRALQVAHNLLKVINDFRFEWKNTPYSVSASVGFVEINADTSGVDELLSNADMACYLAKDQGGNRIKVFAGEDDELSRKKGELQWISRLNQALEKKQFRLYEQAILPVAPHDKEIKHSEFLIRLENPDGTVMGPEAFVPAAEHYHLIGKIDRWVIDTAFKYLADMLEQGNTANDLGVYFLSVSGPSLQDGDFYGFVKDKLDSYGIPGEMVCFEVKEATALMQYGPAIDFIKNIRESGCRIAIDDFGAGLSSFSYLKSVPVDYVKIDGGFIGHVDHDPMDCAIVEAINQIGHIAGLQTIAELVESDSIMFKLKDIGVDYAQGNKLDAPHPIGNAFLQSA
ncbi:MAG: EAL domain-containing protein [Gammaproteobacteria bacterium]|jgi:diguanylate cyclase (GGDEF)-like protein